MTKVKTVAILKGGLSAEHDISKKSAQSVKVALKSNGYNVIEVDVNNDFLSWAIKNKDNVDVFFNALHGQWGEDGKIQGVLEYLGVPYTHSGVTASCLGMDKELSKKIFKNEGIKVPEGKVVTNNQILKKDPYKRPFIMKPVSEGSSFGVHIIKKNTSIEKVIKGMKEKIILVEEYIQGNDYTVALMNGKILGVLEIIPKQSFYNFSAKYRSEKTIYKYPKKTPPEMIKKIIKYSKLANKAIKCTGITRVDFRVNDKNKDDIYVLEINTQPGLTKSSLVPKIAKQSGISFNNLIDWIVKDAKVNKV
ncbi:MAG: D-alanine--D-alanine ligase [Alphaproteobacteria bacterium TMED93]|nr:MAG: D-alanine--D-alanine ligase [Alphaproteobacteria bacterium TMED93]